MRLWKLATLLAFMAGCSYLSAPVANQLTIKIPSDITGRSLPSGYGDLSSTFVAKALLTGQEGAVFKASQDFSTTDDTVSLSVGNLPYGTYDLVVKLIEIDGPTNTEIELYQGSSQVIIQGSLQTTALSLARVTALVTGMVTYDGNPVKDALITGFGTMDEVMTAMDGSFAVSGVKTGRHSLTVAGFPIPAGAVLETPSFLVATGEGVTGASLKVVGNIAVTSVNLNSSAETLAVGGTKLLFASFVPSNATNQTVTWTSDNQTVAAVDPLGKVSAVSAGTATITVTTQDGNKTATCGITVVVPVTGVTLSQGTIMTVPNYTQMLTATIQPSNATNQGLTWFSSNPGVVTVNSYGQITATAIGTATITVTTIDGSYTATCVVNVNPPAVKNLTIDFTNPNFPLNTGPLSFSAMDNIQLMATGASFSTFSWKLNGVQVGTNNILFLDWFHPGLSLGSNTINLEVNILGTNYPAILNFIRNP